jgi:hypothetical protein
LKNYRTIGVSSVMSKITITILCYVLCIYWHCSTYISITRVGNQFEMQTGAEVIWRHAGATSPAVNFNLYLLDLLTYSKVTQVHIKHIADCNDLEKKQRD